MSHLIANFIHLGLLSYFGTLLLCFYITKYMCTALAGVNDFMINTYLAL